MKLLWVIRLLGAMSMLILPYTGFSYHPTSNSFGGISIASADEHGDADEHESDHESDHHESDNDGGDGSD